MRQTYKIFKWWSLGGIFCFTILCPNYLLAVRGLNILSIKEGVAEEEKKGNVSIVKEKIELEDDALLATINSIIGTGVKQLALLEDIDEAKIKKVPPAEEEDSDIEGVPSSSKKEKLKKIDKRSYLQNIKNITRNGPSKKWPSYDFKRNYVLANEPIPTPTRLSIEAKMIHESMKGNTSHTVVFCVALLNKDGYIKKFAFHNNESNMNLDSARRAIALGYDIIRAEQSHAEGQFLQFLHQRNARKIPLYTHIIGMGCSKAHCAECDCLLRLILGDRYWEITAAMIKKPLSEQPPKVKIAQINKDEYSLNRELECTYKIALGEGAIENGRKYDNFYIAKRMISLISERLGYEIILKESKYVKVKPPRKRKKIDVYSEQSP